jgi:predicted dehydrogenase
MVQKADGMNYAPKGKAEAVVGPGDFRFAAMALDHGHIYGQCNGLVEAGAELVKVYDPDPEKVARFVDTYPGTAVAKQADEILSDPSIHLVAAAAIPNQRGPLGCRVMQAGKDYLTDKTPFTTTAQLESARQVVRETGRRYAVYYSERLHVESAVYAGNLIEQGAIGEVVHVMGLGPHRLSAASRPDWFFDKEQYGGILCDIGSHQIEQFLYYVGAKDATVTQARVANYANPGTPELEDWGDATLVADNGATFYFRVDWFTPDGLRTWGDGRTMIVGTEGTIELRKYLDVAQDERGDHVYLVNREGEQHLCVNGEVGFPFFGDLILDCLNGTENAMTQSHTFKAAELCLVAQEMADQAGLLTLNRTI